MEALAITIAVCTAILVIALGGWRGVDRLAFALFILLLIFNYQSLIEKVTGHGMGN